MFVYNFFLKNIIFTKKKCKHLLAVKIANAIHKYQEHEIKDEEFAYMSESGRGI